MSRPPLGKTAQRLVASATVAISMTVAVTPAAGFDVAWARGPAIDPRSAYGDGITFQIRRDGDPVGQHTVRFERRGDDLIVRARTELAVRILFVTAYRFTYASTDVWRDGQLVALAAETDDNGKRSRVEARLDGEVVTVTGRNGSQRTAAGVFPTNHWHPGVLAESRVLNTITGSIDAVSIVDRGLEQVEVNGRPQQARRFAYTGELTNEVWYDAEGRWVKMRFQAKDGSSIEYVCTACPTDRLGPA